MSHLDPLISDLALILVVAGITTIIFKWLKQPVVLGYIVAGFLCSGNFLLEGVSDIANVNIWAEIGIIFLLFSLGLEFSFKKLVNVGGSSLMTALVIIIGMMCSGYMAGQMLGWSATDSIFLGGMLSMSSTTIIIKAFSDLGLKNRKFTTQVFGVLIVEDLFAVVLMVMLSTIYMQKNIEEIVLAERLFKLLFFLVLWFMVGIYLIPTMLKKIKRFLNNETLLIVSLGLCLGMVVMANYVGFSSALGAFVMGSVLAGTSQVQHIEKITAPVKDLFGAVFFVSVGMLVEPAMLAEYIMPILLITVVVIVGQIVYSTLGFIISGQDLKISLQSAFSLAQIGEFAFIIAAMGLSMGVTSSFLYPVAVAVSVITTFATPFIIRLSEPAYKLINRKMPPRINNLITRYSAFSQSTDNQTEWKQLLQKSLYQTGAYSILLAGMVWIAFKYYMPFVEGYFSGFWGHIISTATTILFMTPLLWALSIRHIDRRIFITLWRNPRFNRALLISILILRVFLGVMFMMAVLVHLYSYRWGTIIGFSMILLLMALFWKRIKKWFLHFEYQFYSNLHNNENSKITPIDKHAKFLNVANLTVSADSPMTGKSMEQLNLRTGRGITVVSISRGHKRINTPGAKDMLMPYDRIAVVGSDTSLKEFAPQIEFESQPDKQEEDITMRQFTVTENSILIGMTISQFSMMNSGNCLVIGIERQNGSYVEPLSLVRFKPFDTVWIAGGLSSIKKALGS